MAPCLHYNCSGDYIGVNRRSSAAKIVFQGKDFLDCLFESGKIAFDHLPDNFHVDAKVLMHNDVSEAGGQSSNFSGVLCTETRR